MISTGRAIIIILLTALATFLTRLLPFLLFKEGKTPRLVEYLGSFLPPAIMAMLIVYSLKGFTLLKYPYMLPELIAIFSVLGLHLWKRNNLLSILGGTALYMFLIQKIFI